MEKLEIVNNIYNALNDNDISGVRKYLADDVQLVPLRRDRALEIIDGIAAVSDSIEKMLSISIDTNVVFKSGPYVMGDVVAVEYIHHYKFNGEARHDHNVSVLIISDGKVIKWTGYMHPK